MAWCTSRLALVAVGGGVFGWKEEEEEVGCCTSERERERRAISSSSSSLSLSRLCCVCVGLWSVGPQGADDRAAVVALPENGLERNIPVLSLST